MSDTSSCPFSHHLPLYLSINIYLFIILILFIYYLFFFFLLAALRFSVLLNISVFLNLTYYSFLFQVPLSSLPLSSYFLLFCLFPSFISLFISLLSSPLPCGENELFFPPNQHKSTEIGSLVPRLQLPSLTCLNSSSATLILEEKSFSNYDQLQNKFTGIKAY